MLPFQLERLEFRHLGSHRHRAHRLSTDRARGSGFEVLSEHKRGVGALGFVDGQIGRVELSAGV